MLNNAFIKNVYHGWLSAEQLQRKAKQEAASLLLSDWTVGMRGGAFFLRLVDGPDVAPHHQ